MYILMDGCQDLLDNVLKVLSAQKMLNMGGGTGMGNTCKPLAVSFQCMTKSTTNKKKKKKKKMLNKQGLYIIK